MQVLTKRDIEITEFLSRVKIARPDQIEDRFEISRSTAYARLAFLTEIGLVGSAERISPEGRVFYATREGNARARLGLPIARPTVGKLTHDLAATSVIAGLERSGVPCLAERELRAHQRFIGDSRFLFDVDDHLARRIVPHSPDIVCEIEQNGPFVALEVELSTKDVRRWRELLSGFYRRLGVAGFIGVLYLAGPKCGPARIIRIANEVGLGDHFQLRLTTDDDILDGLLDIVGAEEVSSWTATRKAA